MDQSGPIRMLVHRYKRSLFKLKCEWIASGYWVEESVQNKIQRPKQREKKNQWKKEIVEKKNFQMNKPHCSVLQNGLIQS